jgi:glutaminyl-peptide cyclotransferase
LEEEKEVDPMKKMCLIVFFSVALLLGSRWTADSWAEKWKSGPTCGAEKDKLSSLQKRSEQEDASKKRIEIFFEELMRLSPRPAGSETLQECRVFLINTLKSFSLEVWEEAFTADTPKGPLPMANVIAEKMGGDQGVIYLGSHIDTKLIQGIEIPGANDSASSTAALLELARILSEKETELTYRFAFFDGEESIAVNMTERDGLYGSKHHVLRLQDKGKIPEVRAMILLDMMGDRDLAVNRDLNSSKDLWGLFSSCCRNLGFAEVAGGTASYMYDDHAPFLQAGVRSLDIIDFDYGPDNSYWHTEEDTADKVSVDSIYKIVQAVLCMLDSLEKNEHGRIGEVTNLNRTYSRQR